MLLAVAFFAPPVSHASNNDLVAAPPVGPMIRHQAFNCPTNSCSTNWSGYAVTGAKGSVTYAAGSWIVPAISGTCSSTAQYSSFWVGIDGYSSNTVEQTGTDSDCQGGSPTYYAWYEFYPHPSYLVTGMTVSPGDTMSAEVAYAGGVFTVTINDLTTGASFSTSSRMNSAQRSSAEWIAEAPSSGGVLPLANFGTAYFGSEYTGVSSTNYATIGGASQPIGSFPAASTWQITMTDSSGNPISVPSGLTGSGTSFSVSTTGSGTTTTSSSTSSTSTKGSGSNLVVTVTTDSSSYSAHSWVHITVHVADSSGSPVSGASVTVSVTNPNGGVSTGSGTTNSNGDATFRYKVSAVTGTYTVNAAASASGYTRGTGSTTFTVS